MKHVRRWSTFHDNLPESNRNKISVSNLRIVLLSHLYGRAKDLCKRIENKVISSHDVVDIIINAFNKHNPLYIFTLAYGEVQLLLSTRHYNHETYRNFEVRY